MKQTTTQTRNPRNSRAESLLDRENFHYVKAQKDDNQFEGGLEALLDKPSYEDPTKPMYEIAYDGQKSEDRAVAGSRKNVVLRCSKADYDAMMKENTDIVARRSQTVAEDETISGHPAVLSNPA